MGSAFHLFAVFTREGTTLAFAAAASAVVAAASALVRSALTARPSTCSLPCAAPRLGCPHGSCLVLSAGATASQPPWAASTTRRRWVLRCTAWFSWSIALCLESSVWGGCCHCMPTCRPAVRLTPPPTPPHPQFIAQAARAYDKMMLWCELHNAAGVKGGITNFDPSGASSACRVGGRIYCVLLSHVWGLVCHQL